MASATTISQNNLTAAEAYYKAMSDKNAGAMGKYLHPDVKLLGPMGELSGKEKVFEAAKEPMKRCKSVTVRTKYAQGDQVIFIYDMQFDEPVGRCRTAALMDFKDGLIERNELFFDSLPFEKAKTKSAPEM